MEEKLKELFDLKTEPHKHGIVKSEISREDLLSLYEHFLKEGALFEGSESWLKTLKEKDGAGFCVTSYYGVTTVYKYFQSKQTGDFRIGGYKVQYGSDRYKRLETFYTENEGALAELFNNIGSLCLSGNTIEQGSEWENKIRYFYSECKEDLQVLSELCGTAALEEPENRDVSIRKSYRETTEKANEKKFSCIRRSVMPACYFPILYRHFFVKNDSEYSDIGIVNKFLYRALKLENDEAYCVFVPETLSIRLKKKAELEKYYHVNRCGEILDFQGDRYDSLLHELMHFMNAIDSFDGSKKSEEIRIYLTDIIKDTKVVSNLTFSEEEIYPKKGKKEKKEGEEEEEEEEKHEKLEEMVETLERALGNLYDKGVETWTMYGIFIWEDKQNPKKYEFYYDPINEAVADSECKIIDGKQERVVRTGHCEFIGSPDEYIDPYDETSPLKIEILNRKIGIYQFYFNKCETLEKLIHK